MKINLKQELTKQWFKNLQDIICKNIEEIENNKMATQETKEGFTYTYCLKPGISEVKGGLKVLSDMNYPSEILNDSKSK